LYISEEVVIRVTDGRIVGIDDGRYSDHSMDIGSKAMEMGMLMGMLMVYLMV